MTCAYCFIDRPAAGKCPGCGAFPLPGIRRRMDEMLVDNRSGRTSATTTAFIAAFLASTVVILHLTFTCDKLTEGYFGLYLGAFCASSVGSKLVNTWGGKGKPGTKWKPDAKQPPGAPAQNPTLESETE